MEPIHKSMISTRKNRNKNSTRASDGYFKRKKNSKSQILYTNEDNRLPVNQKHDAYQKESEIDSLITVLGKKGADSAIGIWKMSYLNGVGKQTNHEAYGNLNTSQTISKSEATTKTENPKKIRNKSESKVKLYPKMKRSTRYHGQSIQPLKLKSKQKNHKSYEKFNIAEIIVKKPEKRRKNKLMKSVEPENKGKSNEECLNIITEDDEELKHTKESFLPSLSRVTDFRSFDNDSKKHRFSRNLSISKETKDQL